MLPKKPLTIIHMSQEFNVSVVDKNKKSLQCSGLESPTCPGGYTVQGIPYAGAVLACHFRKRSGDTRNQLLLKGR
jgi:hypothetical protein